MKKQKENVEPSEINLASTEDFNPPFSFQESIKIDEDLVNKLEDRVNELKETLKKKKYAIDIPDLARFEEFIYAEAEWNSTESLGVVQIWNEIKKIKKEGIKDGFIYLTSLPLEASHYFLSKSKGKGFESAKSFIDLYKPFDKALSDVKNDNMELRELESKLNAAKQGLNLG